MRTNATGGFFFYSVILSFLLGVALESWVFMSLPTVAWLVAVGLVLVVLQRRGSGAHSAFYVGFVALCVFAFSVGMLRLHYEAAAQFSTYLESHVGEEVSLVGVVRREPDVRARTTHLYIHTDEGTVLAKAGPYVNAHYGDRLRVSGVLQKPESFTTDLGRTFHYDGYLHARGVSYVLAYAEIEETDPGHGNPVVAFLLFNKHAFMQKIEQVLPEPEVGLGEGVLLGVKRALGDELEQVFRDTGIIHIVVLSGYNVMLVVLFVNYILARLFGKRIRSVLGLAAIVAFALIVGPSATVVRASIMAGLLLLAALTNRTYLVLRALMIAAAIMVLINPYILLYDSGFQLSFMATLGLILFAADVESWLTSVPHWFGVREFLTATLVTQVFVLPLLLYQIGEVSLIAVIVNVLVLPMVPVAMFATFVLGCISFIVPPLVPFLAYITYLSLHYILGIATFFAAVPFATVAVPPFPVWVLLLAYLGLGYLLWRFKIRTNDELAGWTIVERREYT